MLSFLCISVGSLRSLHVQRDENYGDWDVASAIIFISLPTCRVDSSIVRLNIIFRSIRGRLGSLPLLFRNIGILIAYILGAMVDYKYIPWICVTIPIVFIVYFMTLPNTSQYYLQRGSFEVLYLQQFN